MSLTPREVSVLIKTFLDWQDVEQQRHGTVAAMAWNAHKFNPKKRKTWVEWHQLLPPFGKRRKRRGLTLEEMQMQARDQIKDTYGR